MKKKNTISNHAIIGIGILALLFMALFGFIIMHPDNNSDISRWFKTNFFPADDYGLTSLLDTDEQAVSSQEYKGSTPSAWLLCGALSAIAIILSVIYLAKERGII